MKKRSYLGIAAVLVTGAITAAVVATRRAAAGLFDNVDLSLEGDSGAVPPPTPHRPTAPSSARLASSDIAPAYVPTFVDATPVSFDCGGGGDCGSF